VLSTPLRLIGTILGAYLFNRITYVLIDRLFEIIQQEQTIALEFSQRSALRTTTFSRVLKSLATIFWFSAAIMSVLSSIGVDLLPLLAGAGIIGLGISFAAQSVVKDVINGFFILLEDWYAVGDVIAIGNVSGLVENINLRITQIRDAEGSLISIPNSEVKIAHNRSKDWSRVNLTIQIAYGTDPDRALAVMHQLAMELYHDREWRSKLIEPPEILGIDEIDHSGLLIRIWIKTQPLKQWEVAREFRRRLTLVMERENLAVGKPQQLLQFPRDFN
jgi:small conductance mechanosensitive channel